MMEQDIDNSNAAVVSVLGEDIRTTAAIIDLFKQTTTDLLWSSESDYPFEIVTWEAGIELIPSALFGDLDQAKYEYEQIESMSLVDLFAPVITVEDWYGDEELAQVDRYTALFSAIESNLVDIKVFRVGTVEIAIYIVGKTPTGDILGLKTLSVET
jgi:hypothetical protein